MRPWFERALARCLATLVLAAAVARAAAACDGLPGPLNGFSTLQTSLNGVPAILRAPRVVTQPPIVLWHGFGPPASEADLMKALPLDEVPAVKVYLGLPLFGARTPTAADESLAQRQAQDYGTRIFEPVVLGAARELPGVVAALRRMNCLGEKDRVSLFGFSAGGAAVLSVLIESQVPVRSAVVLNAPLGLNAAIAALERATHHPYVWTRRTRDLALRTDPVRHAQEIASASPPPKLLLINGADDPLVPPSGSALLLHTLEPLYHDKGSEGGLATLVLPDVTHDWTGSAGLAQVRTKVASWFNSPRLAKSSICIGAAPAQYAVWSGSCAGAGGMRWTYCSSCVPRYSRSMPSHPGCLPVIPPL